MNKPKIILASSYASIITIIFVVAITIGAEKFSPLKDWLKSISGHHWTTKSIFSVIVYAACTLLFSVLPMKGRELHVRKALHSLIWTTVFGILVLVLFFIGHYIHFI